MLRVPNGGRVRLVGHSTGRTQTKEIIMGIMTSDGFSKPEPEPSKKVYLCISCGEEAEEGVSLCEDCQESFDKEMERN